MRGHMDPAEYKHVALGLIFLKYISDVFQVKYEDLAARQSTDYTDPEDRDEYLAENVFWVPATIVRAFEEAVHPLFQRILANLQEAQMLAITRDALLPKLLSGQIQIHRDTCHAQ